MNKPALLWLRHDFRLADNPALTAAVAHGSGVIPVFIHAPEEESPWQPGGASDWWRHQSLAALDQSLRHKNLRLIIRRGLSLETLHTLVKDTGASAVFWNRRYEPAIISRDAKVKESLRNDGIKVESFNGALLHEPWMIRNKSDKPFQVFTPFWKNCLSQPDPDEPLSTPKTTLAPDRWPKSLALEELELEPKIKWDGGLRTSWQPGEAGAVKNLNIFLAQAFD